MRSRFLVRDTRSGTHQPFAVISYLLCFHIINQHQTVTLLHGCGNTLNQTLVILVLHLQPIYNHLNIMVTITV